MLKKGRENIMKDFLLKRIALPTLVLAWAVSYYFEVMGYSAKNHYLIQPIFWIMFILYIINTIGDYREWKNSQKNENETSISIKDVDKKKAFKLVSVLAVMFLYAFVMSILGFLISTFIFTFAVLWIMGERKWYKLAFIPLGLDVFLYAVFYLGLRIPLPVGFLGF